MKKGFFVPVTILLLVFVGVIIGVILSVTENFTINTSKYSENSYYERYLLNSLHLSIGYIRTKSKGLSGFTGLTQTSKPSWYNEFMSKLDSNTREYIQNSVNLGQSNNPWQSYRIYSYSQNAYPSPVENVYRNEIQGLINESNGLITDIESYAFPINRGSYQLLVVTMVKGPKTGFAYSVVAVDPLNKYLYFSESEGQNIWYTEGTKIYGPLKSNSTIRLFYRSDTQKPTFYGTLEAKDFVRWRSGAGPKTISSTNPDADRMLKEAANLYGNPNYRFLSQEDISKLSVSNISNQYFSQINSFVLDLNNFKQNVGGNKDSKGLKLNFNCQITLGENQIEIRNTQSGHPEYNYRYVLSWSRDDMSRTTFKIYNGSGQEIERKNNIVFNGIVYTTGEVDLTKGSDINENIIYSGKITLIADGDIRLRRRIISKTAFNYLTTQGVQANEEYPAELNNVEELQRYILENEKSSLNLVSKGYIWVYNRPQNMKIFANLYAFGDGKGFGVRNFSEEGFQGQLLLFGSLVQSERQPIGNFDPNNPNWKTGYDRLYIHDKRNSLGMHQSMGTPVASEKVMIQYLGVAF